MWSFEARGTLGTMATTKAWRRLDDLPKKSVSWNMLSARAPEGHPIPERVFWKRVVFLSTFKCLNVTLESFKVVWPVLRPHHGDSHIHGNQCGGEVSNEG